MTSQQKQSVNEKKQRNVQYLLTRTRLPIILNTSQTTKNCQLLWNQQNDVNTGHRILGQDSSLSQFKHTTRLAIH